MIIKKSNHQGILLKGEKIITIKASKRSKAHKRRVKTKDESEKVKESRLQNQLNFFENSIKNQDYETVGVYNEQGQIIFQKDGEKDRVDISKEEGLKCHGQTMTHNHPKGYSFSPADILCACQNEMKEMRCISKADGSKYSMSMKDGSNFNRKLWDDKFYSVQRDINNKVHEDFIEKINNKEMTITECNNKHWNAVWGLVSELCPELKYTVIK